MTNFYRRGISSSSCIHACTFTRNLHTHSAYATICVRLYLKKWMDVQLLISTDHRIPQISLSVSFVCSFRFPCPAYAGVGIGLAKAMHRYLATASFVSRPYSDNGVFPGLIIEACRVFCGRTARTRSPCPVNISNLGPINLLPGR